MENQMPEKGRDKGQRDSGKGRKRNALRTKMLMGMLLTMVPVLILITVLFWQTRSVLLDEYISTNHHDLREISRRIDEKLEEIEYVSSVYADNETLNEYAEKDYSQVSREEKMSDIIWIHRRVFETASLLGQWAQMSAIYTNEGTLLNFLDPNNDTPEVREKLEEMEVNAPDALMRMIWYPVQKNFLVSSQSEDIHEQMAVIGSRRVYSWERNRYEYAQIFAIDEAEIYEIYREKAESIHGDIYIVDTDGNLISSSDTEALKSGAPPEQLTEFLENGYDEAQTIHRDGGYEQIILEPSRESGWVTVMSAPVRAITRDVDQLYLKFTVILIICMIVSGMLLLWLYKSFMEPIGKLNNSMREVYGGNLNAYVEIGENARKNEINEMMLYYNSMLRRINTHIIEKLKMDRTKKELELEVLMSQINPHFLYNTLETIVWKSNEAGRPDIGRLAASLGRMYRLSISGGQVIVPMEHEIEHLMAYVKIQKNRYGDAVEFDLRSDIRQMHELYSLKILLQPVVENAFLYGMEGIERTMKIRVTIHVDGEWVKMRVADNGCGMGRDRLEQVRAQIREGRKNNEEENNRRSTGIGLHSVQMRIMLYFGIENAVSISSRRGRGTCVTVRIPKITRENAGLYPDES